MPVLQNTYMNESHSVDRMKKEMLMKSIFRYNNKYESSLENVLKRERKKKQSIIILRNT